MNKIRYCKKCKKYTIKKICCGGKTILRIPPKYSPNSKIGKYRRKMKAIVLKERGLL